jgi:hypothetical protein
MQASFDLFQELPASTPDFLPECTGDAFLRRQPPGADRSRQAFRKELGSSYVGTVRFDVVDGDVVRVSQFTPAGNQCIGLYPEPLKAIGQVMLLEVLPGSHDGGWSGVIEWDVPSDQAAPSETQASEQEPAAPR